MQLHIIHQGLSVSSVSNGLLNQDMSLEKGITYSYTPGIYAEGYIAFVFPFVMFVRSFPSRYRDFSGILETGSGSHWIGNF